MKRLLAAVLLAALSLVQPAHAQPSNPSVAQVQAALADMGNWSLEHQAVMQLAARPLMEMDAFTAILDQFAEGDLNERAAVRELEGWRGHARESIAQARNAANALRPPPSLALYGPTGV